MVPESTRREWQRLVDALDHWTAATAVAEDRIRVQLPGTTAAPQGHVEIVISPDDWDIWSSTVSGSFETAFEDVRRAVLELPDGHPFLVHDHDELRPSMTDTLPPDPEEERLARLVRDNPGRPIGTWVAIGRDGKEHPFPEPPPRHRDE